MSKYDSSAAGISSGPPTVILGSLFITPVSIARGADFSRGAIFGGAIGYEFDAPIPGTLRLELEGSSRRKGQGEFIEPPEGNVLFIDLSAENIIFPAPFVVPGGFTQIDSPDEFLNFQRSKSTSAMLNAVYESPPIANLFSLYVGGGLGAAHTAIFSHSFNGTSIADVIFFGPIEEVNAGFWGFAWQAMGGVNVAVSPRFEFFLEGRFGRTATAKQPPVPTEILLTTQGQSFTHKSALAGVRFKFK